MAHLAAGLARIAAGTAWVVAAASAGPALASGDSRSIPDPAQAAPPRPVVVRPMVAGGLRHGQVMQIAAGRSEIIAAPAAGSPRLAGAPAASPETQTCRQ